MEAFLNIPPDSKEFIRAKRAEVLKTFIANEQQASRLQLLREAMTVIWQGNKGS
jgi:hypothetical protein